VGCHNYGVRLCSAAPRVVRGDVPPIQRGTANIAPPTTAATPHQVPSLPGWEIRLAEPSRPAVSSGPESIPVKAPARCSDGSHMPLAVSDPEVSVVIVLAVAAVIVITVVGALVDVLKQPSDARFQSGTKTIWVIVILLTGVVGALLYLVAGQPRRSPASRGGHHPSLRQPRFHVPMPALRVRISRHRSRQSS
jgi:hypothetical protein